MPKREQGLPLVDEATGEMIEVQGTGEVVQCEDPNKYISVPEKEPLSVQQLIALAIEKGTDPDGLEKLVGLMERIEDRNAEKEFNKALLNFQNECPVVAHNATGYKGAYDYTKYDYLVRTIQPHMQKNGLSHSYEVDRDSPPGYVRLKTTIHHTGGHSRTTLGPPFPAEPIKGSFMNAPQGVGMAWTYAMRRGLESALGIATGGDDDAQGEQEFVDENQIANLEALIEEVNANVPRFQQHFGIDQLAHLPKGKYPAAVRMLTAKRRQG